MSEVLLFGILGLGTGVFYAGLGLGVVLTWRGSGTVNLAAGAMAMLVAFVYWALTTQGELSPAVRLSVSDGPMPTPGFPDLACLRRCARRPAIPTDLSTPAPRPRVGQDDRLGGRAADPPGTGRPRYGSGVKAVPDILPNGPDDILMVAGVGVPTNRLFLAAGVVVLTGVLWAVFRYSRAAWARWPRRKTSVAPCSQACRRTGWASSAGCWAAWPPERWVWPRPSPSSTPGAHGRGDTRARATLVGRFTSFAVTAAAGLALGSRSPSSSTSRP